MYCTYDTIRPAGSLALRTRERSFFGRHLLKLTFLMLLIYVERDKPCTRGFPRIGLGLDSSCMVTRMHVSTSLSTHLRETLISVRFRSQGAAKNLTGSFGKFDTNGPSTADMHGPNLSEKATWWIMCGKMSYLTLPSCSMHLLLVSRFIECLHTTVVAGIRRLIASLEYVICLPLSI